MHPRYDFRRDRLLQVLLLGAALLFAASPSGFLRSAPGLVDWATLATLLGLLVLTKMVEQSGALLWLALRLADRLTRERSLALFLVAISALLAMIVTNDIALFVVVPLTLMLARVVELRVLRLVIFEALAVNAGSLLSPIGNPQNILLWQGAGVGFGGFVLGLLPLFAFCSIALAGLTVVAFSPTRLERHGHPEAVAADRRLFGVAATLYPAFLLLADLHQTAWALVLVLLATLAVAPRLLLRVDWPLLAVFLLMFVDLGLLAQHPLPAWLDLRRASTLYATSALLSQAISNVPAAIALRHYSADWVTIAWGVNVGGFGLAIGSLANLIALRLSGQRNALLAFHRWSVPFFVVTAFGGWALLRTIRGG